MLACTSIDTSFPFIVEFHIWIYIIIHHFYLSLLCLSIHLFMTLGFPFFAILNNADRNIHVQVFVWIYVFISLWLYSQEWNGWIIWQLYV